MRLKIGGDARHVQLCSGALARNGRRGPARVRGSLRERQQRSATSSGVWGRSSRLLVSMLSTNADNAG